MTHMWPRSLPDWQQKEGLLGPGILLGPEQGTVLPYHRKSTGSSCGVGGTAWAANPFVFITNVEMVSPNCLGRLVGG